MVLEARQAVEQQHSCALHQSNSRLHSHQQLPQSRGGDTSLSGSPSAQQPTPVQPPLLSPYPRPALPSRSRCRGAQTGAAPTGSRDTPSPGGAAGRRSLPCPCAGRPACEEGREGRGEERMERGGGRVINGSQGWAQGVKGLLLSPRQPHPSLLPTLGSDQVKLQTSSPTPSVQHADVPQSPPPHTQTHRLASRFFSTTRSVRRLSNASRAATAAAISSSHSRSRCRRCASRPCRSS